ncbi:hypothetical protein HKCCE4037_17915 [Rhodobacterales bacterium HKCCE4037]|nr:hypothetical protein [Rhodobacterales bacterium HKCCE4037]
MTRALIALPVLALLSGCLGTTPRPLDVEVSRDGIEVRMSNRQTCLGPAPQPGTSWSGTLQGCASPYPYRVVLDDGGNPLRTVLEEGASAIGLTLAPVAEVEIDGPAGNTWRFSSPDADPFDD